MLGDRLSLGASSGQLIGAQIIIARLGKGTHEAFALGDNLGGRHDVISRAFEQVGEFFVHPQTLAHPALNATIFCDSGWAVAARFSGMVAASRIDVCRSALFGSQR